MPLGCLSSRNYYLTHKEDGARFHIADKEDEWAVDPELSGRSWGSPKQQNGGGGSRFRAGFAYGDKRLVNIIPNEKLPSLFRTRKVPKPSELTSVRRLHWERACL